MASLPGAEWTTVQNKYIFEEGARCGSESKIEFPPAIPLRGVYTKKLRTGHDHHYPSR